jgi:hypothetical protein
VLADTGMDSGTYYLSLGGKGVVWEIRVMNAEAKTVVKRGRKLPQVLKERRAAVQSMHVVKNPDIR